MISGQRGQHTQSNEPEKAIDVYQRENDNKIDRNEFVCRVKTNNPKIDAACAV
jgi:Ca2+-binding EF-hand superfamily protein